MTKSDLKTGMRVTLRNGSTAFILKECTQFYEQQCIGAKDIYVSKETDSWDGIQYTNDDLTGIWHDEFDIVKIEIPRHPYEIFKENGMYQTLWKREEPKEMTIEEIQKELGYKIKVVKNKK